ncbi:MAG: mannose-1-phosphate guanylyltransferase, partial [Deltaproteobacteria bacterium]|nr:mannose-1-phosphate guanylyltransferase [Deltaproteobacteria bacterium]
MTNKCYAVIMAGGRGERFWPLSKKTLPKPFIPLLKKETMIQETVERIKPLIPEERIIIVLSQDHFPVAQQQLPEIPVENFVIEPFGRDTAACIGLASLYIGRKDKDASMIVLAADHLIADREAFFRTVTSSLKFLVSNDCLVTVGIKPTRPETGYGYIELGEKLGSIDNESFFVVKKFVEKPRLSTASDYLKTDRYCWNSGMFVWRNSTIQKSLSVYMPELWDGLVRINECLGSEKEEEVMKKEFSQFERVSIDYGVLEKSSQVVVIPASFNWDDVGTWTALERVYSLDESDNVVVGKHVGRDTHGCIVFSRDQLVATLGVKDLVIVHAKGKILVCHKEKAPY